MTVEPRQIVAAIVKNKTEESDGWAIELTVPAFGSQWPTRVSRVPAELAAQLIPGRIPTLVLSRQNIKRPTGDAPPPDGSRPYHYYWGLEAISEEAATPTQRVGDDWAAGAARGNAISAAATVLAAHIHATPIPPTTTWDETAVGYGRFVAVLADAILSYRDTASAPTAPPQEPLTQPPPPPRSIPRLGRVRSAGAEGPLENVGALFARCAQAYGMARKDVLSALGVHTIADIEDCEEAWAQIKAAERAAS